MLPASHFIVMDHILHPLISYTSYKHHTSRIKVSRHPLQFYVQTPQHKYGVKMLRCTQVRLPCHTICNAIILLLVVGEGLNGYLPNPIAVWAFSRMFLENLKITKISCNLPQCDIVQTNVTEDALIKSDPLRIINPNNCNNLSPHASN